MVVVNVLTKLVSFDLALKSTIITITITKNLCNALEKWSTGVFLHSLTDNTLGQTNV